MCKAIREGDEMACSCGLRWDIDEVDPHDPFSPNFAADLELSNLMLTPKPTDDRTITNGHILYKPSDFTPEESLDVVGIAVIDGGLSVCKVCHEYESGLNGKCKGKK